MDNYIQLTDLKSALRIQQSGSDLELSRAISSASRNIDEFCDDYFGYSDPTEKLFRPSDEYVMYVGSYASADDVTIELDYDGDGSFSTTLLANEWQPEPVDRDLNKPYNTVALLTGRTFPGTRGLGINGGSWANWDHRRYPTQRRARIRMTARWGWPEVPDQVKQACLILSIAQYKSKDLTGGVAGSTTMATGAFGAKRDILVQPSAMDPIAFNLLRGLRTVVVA